MPSPLRTATILKLLAGLLIAVGLGVIVYRLEQQRPIEALERAGAEVLRDPEGMPRIVTFTGNRAGDTELEQLGRLTMVTEVNLSGSRVTREGVERLQSLEQLRRLDLSDTSEAAGSLEPVSRLARLRSLNLRRCAWVDDADLAVLGELQELVELDLSGTPITDAALPGLARLPRLRMLQLNDCELITDEGWKTLRSLPELAELSLDHCRRLTESGLPTCASFPALRLVSVHGLPVRRSVLRQLWSTAPQMTISVDYQDVAELQALWPLGPMLWINQRFEVKRLDLDDKTDEAVVTDAESAVVESPIDAGYDLSAPAGPVAAMMMAPVFNTSAARHIRSAAPIPISDGTLTVLKDHPTITRLTLAEVPVTDAGLATIAELRALKLLRLRRVAITDAGLASLASLQQLEQLILEQDSLTGEGLGALKDLPALRRLVISSSQLTVTGLQQVGSLSTLNDLLIIGPVPAGGIEYLDGLSALRQIELRGATLDGPATQALTRMPRLAEVTLVDSTLTAEVFEALGGCPSLRQLSLNQCEFPRPAAEKFAEERTDVVIWVNRRSFREQLATP